MPEALRPIGATAGKATVARGIDTIAAAMEIPRRIKGRTVRHDGSAGTF